MLGTELSLVTLQEHTTIITHIVEHPTKPLIAIGNTWGEIRVFNTDDYRLVYQLELQGAVQALEISTDGKLLVAADKDGITFWEFMPNALVQFKTIQTDDIRTLTLSTDSTWLAAAGPRSLD